MSETRNLCTVPAGTVADETNFIVEESRELKRIPKAEVIKTRLADMTVLDLCNLLNNGANAEVNAQTFMDTMADMVANRLLKKSQLINNGLTTEAGVAALDAAYGKNLQDQVNQVNSDLLKHMFLKVSGTTNNSGLLSINANNSFTSGKCYVLTNVSNNLGTPWSVTVELLNNNSITFRIRNMGDNSAITNTTVSAFDVLLIGM